MLMSSSSLVGIELKLTVYETDTLLLSHTIPLLTENPENTQDILLIILQKKKKKGLNNS